MLKFKNIAVENTVGPNIGDGIYQFCIFEILKLNFPRSNVFMIDSPIKRHFNKSGLFKNKLIDVRYIYSADLFVFSGPIIGGNFMEHYGHLIKYLKKNNKEYALLSIHCDPELSMDIIKFLKKYPPILFSSRDNETYEILNDISKHSFKGICNAFFCSLLFPSAISKNQKYITTSFYQKKEPKISFSLDKNGEISIQTLNVNNLLDFENSFIKHFEFLFNSQSHHLNYKIIRLNHDISERFNYKKIGKNNTYISHNPYTYINLYSGTSLTIADRVHACVPTLSYGSPCYFDHSTVRSRLFNAAQLNIQNKIIYPPKKKDLIEKYNRYVSFLK